MDLFIQTFHIDWKILIAQAINFVIVLGVLYLFALKPIRKLMNERSDRIKKGVDDAVVNKELLEKTQEEYDNVLKKARIEAHDIFQKGKKDAEKNKTKMIENAQKDVETIILSGKKILESEKTKMVEEAKNEIVALVVKSTEKLLESNSNNDYDKKILNQIKKL